MALKRQEPQLDLIFPRAFFLFNFFELHILRSMDSLSSIPLYLHDRQLLFLFWPQSITDFLLTLF